MAVEVGAAFVSVRPDMSGFHRAIQRDLRAMVPQMARIGQEWGTALQRGIKEKLRPIEVRLDTGQTAQRLATLNRALDRLDGRTVNIQLNADLGAVSARLVSFEQALSRLDGRTINLQINVDMGGAVAELSMLEQILARLDGRTVNVQVNADIAFAMAQMAAANAEASRLDGRRASINVGADVGSALAAIASVRVALLGLGAAALPALAGLGAGVVGLIGPLAGAAAGAGAFGAVAIPAISNVSKALQQQKQASQQAGSATKSAGAASGQAASQAAAEASARQQLASAIRQAGYAHQQALDQVRSAEQQYQQSLQSEADAQRALTQARQDARRALEDLKNRLVDTQLAVEESQLGIEDARLSWDQMAAAAKTAASKVTSAQDALAKAQAAQAAILDNPQATDAAKRQAQASVDSAKAALKSAEDKKKAADVDTRQAELNYRQAVQRLKEQQLQLRRLQSDERNASKAGVEGSDQVRQARQRLAQANQQVANSELALRRARENVTRVDQQSAEQIASARRALAQASRQAATDTAALSGAMGGLGQQMVKLTPLEQQLATAWQGLTKAFGDWNKSLQPDVIPVLIKGINLLRTSLPLLTPAVRGAAVGIGYLLDRANAAAQSPFWRQFSTFLGQAAAPAIIGFGTILGHVVTGLAGLVQAFAPIGFAFLGVLNAIAQRFSAFATGLASNPAFQAFVRQFQALAPLMAQTFISIGRLVGSLFAAITPALGPALGLINTLATSLGNVLRQVGPAISSVLSTLGQGLSAVIVALAPAVTQLVQALAPLLNQLISGLRPILISLVPVLSQVIAALAPVISALLAGLQPAIQALVPVLGLLVGGIGRILVALAPVLPLLGRFIADLLTGLMPVLTPIVNVLAQVGEQIAFALIQTLRAALPAVQQIVLAVASLLPALLPLIPLWVQLQTAVLPLLPALIQLVAVLVQLLVPVLRVVIVVLVAVISIALRLLIPVVRAIVAVIVWMAGLVAPLISGIGAAFRWLGGVAMWLWTNAIGPAFRFIANLAKWLYSIIAFVVIAPLLIQFKIWAAVARWLWTAVIKPVFTAIGSFIRSTWTGVIRPTLNAIGSFLKSILAPVFRWIYNSVIRPVWNAAGTAIRSVWTGFIRPTFDGIKSALNKLAPAFRTAVSAIGKAWDGLKSAARKPVEFVVNTVFNNGIVKIWGAVAKLVPGMKKLDPVHFARGGVVPGGAYGVLPGYAPGRDTMLAAVSPGEAWIRPDATRALGPDFIYGLNSAAATGGTTSAARFLAERGGPRFGLGGIVGGFLKSAKDLFTDGLVNSAKSAFNPLLSLAQRSIGGTPFGDLSLAATRGLVSNILTHFGPLEGKIGGDSKGVVAAAKKYIGIGDDRGPNNNRFSRAFGMPGAPWCLGAGTLVQTPGGLRPIEDLRAGDEVVTPSGAHQRVSTVFRREKLLLALTALGVCETSVTADHPYWTMRRLTPANRARRLGAPEWVRVGDLRRGDMIAKPIPTSGNSPVAAAYAELLGLYVAEGYRGHRDHSVVLCVARGEAEDVATLVKEAGFDPHIIQHRTCALVAVYDRGLYEAAGEAGDGAENKTVPQRVFDWDRTGREAFMAGYVRGDGHRPGRYPGRVVCQTVSRPLTVSLSGLLLTLRISAGVRVAKRAGTQVIEGRTVQCREKYLIEWSEDQATVDRPQFIWEEDRLWVPVRSVEPTGRVETVYDLTVPGEHAFIADGAHVSNCAMFVSTAIKDAHATKHYRGAPSAAVASFVSGMKHVGLGSGRPGDLAAYRGTGHINLIESKAGGGYMTIGGNQNAVVQRGVRGGQSSILRPSFARGGIVSDAYQIFTREAPRNADPHEDQTPLVQLFKGLDRSASRQVASAVVGNRLEIGHAGTFDSGGWLPPGLSTVYNGTGRPEAVLTQRQLATIGAARGGDRNVSVMDHATVILRDEVDVDMLAQRQGFAARSASFGS